MTSSSTIASDSGTVAGTGEGVGVMQLGTAQGEYGKSKRMEIGKGMAGWMVGEADSAVWNAASGG